MKRSTTKSSATACILDSWLKAKRAAIGRHALSILTEKDGARERLVQDLQEMARDHYVAPEITAKRLTVLGAPETAALLAERLPTTKRARSGDLGEILAIEISECQLAYKVPIRRLRWKDGRDMALRGDDIIGVTRDVKDKLQFLKGESKSRISLTTAVINQAAEALDRDRGRPTRHSVLFIAERLREQGQDDLAQELEEAVLQSFRGYNVEHLIFTLTGSDPKGLLTDHLNACARKKRRRHAIGVYIRDHGSFIKKFFSGLFDA